MPFDKKKYGVMKRFKKYNKNRYCYNCKGYRKPGKRDRLCNCEFPNIPWAIQKYDSNVLS